MADAMKKTKAACMIIQRICLTRTARKMIKTPEGEPTRENVTNSRKRRKEKEKASLRARAKENEHHQMEARKAHEAAVFPHKEAEEVPRKAHKAAETPPTDLTDPPRKEKVKAKGENEKEKVKVLGKDPTVRRKQSECSHRQEAYTH